LYSRLGKEFWKSESEADIYTIDPGGGPARRLSPGGGIDWIGGGQTGLNLLGGLAPHLRPQDPREKDFFEALWHDHPARALSEVERGMDPNAWNEFDIPAVVERAVKSSQGVLRALIAHGANVNAPGPGPGYGFDNAL